MDPHHPDHPQSNHHNQDPTKGLFCYKKLAKPIMLMLLSLIFFECSNRLAIDKIIKKCKKTDKKY